MIEGSNINKSLLALGNVINKLSSSKFSNKFIPYRNSKLTRLLKDSLGGNTKTVLITCITPKMSQINETFQSLNYTKRAKKIEVSLKRKFEEEFRIQSRENSSDSKSRKKFEELESKINFLQGELLKEQKEKQNVELVYQQLIMSMKTQMKLKNDKTKLDEEIINLEGKLVKNEEKLGKIDEDCEEVFEFEIKEEIDSKLKLKLDIEEKLRGMVAEREEWVVKGKTNLRDIRDKSPTIHKKFNMFPNKKNVKMFKKSELKKKNSTTKVGVSSNRK